MEDGGGLITSTPVLDVVASQQTFLGGIFRRKASDSHFRISQIPRVLTFVHLLPVGELLKSVEREALTLHALSRCIVVSLQLPARED